MTDSLGHRAKFAVLAPSTNTSVQPEFDAMRPWGVTNHHSRLIIPDARVTDDRSFMAMMVTCDPNYVLLGMSAETFWDGLKWSTQLKRKAPESCALRRRHGLGFLSRRAARIRPRDPAPWRNHAVHAGGRSASAALLRRIGLPGGQSARAEILRVNRGRVDAIVQVGTNLAMAEVAATAEFWLGKPVIAINTATYWYALRDYGIKDRIHGWGSLLAEH